LYFAISINDSNSIRAKSRTLTLPVFGKAAIKKQSADVKAGPYLFFLCRQYPIRRGMAEQAGKIDIIALQIIPKTKILEILFAKIWKK
jgi:hypothetical protein